MFQQFGTFYLVLFGILYQICANEILVQLNLKRPINIVSDKYVSFSVDPNILFDSINGTNSKITDYMASQLSPAYLKISGNTFFMLTYQLSNDETSMIGRVNISQSIWKNFNDWISAVGLKPIIPLPYKPHDWDSRKALKILNISSALGVKDCIWQLGSDFDATGASSYVADLLTLQTMVDAFSSHTNNWEIIGADLSAGSNPEETRLYTDLTRNIVKSHGWIQPIEQTTSLQYHDNIVFDRDIALRIILNRGTSAWLTLPAKNLKNKSFDDCTQICIGEGLRWAQTLGDAAKTGFNVVFKPLTKSDINEPGFSYYISLLYKKVMGQKVFDLKILNGDRYISHMYAHCTYDMPGAFSMMGVNMVDTKTKIFAKTTTKFTGSEIWQYILTVNDGIVKLNGEPIFLNSTLDPFVKIKHPNRPVTLLLPPLSIGFWILPLANIRECLSDMDSSESMLTLADDNKSVYRIKTSSDRLLQQLITENIAPSKQITKSRNKRHVIVKKDSNYLHKQLKDDIYCNQNTNIDLNRHKRFILKNNRPRIIQNLFETPNSYDFALNDEQRRHKKSFSPVGPFKKMDFFKPKGRRFKRQVVGPFFRRPNFRGKMGGGGGVFRDIPKPFVKRHNFGLRPNMERSNEENLFASRENQNIPQGDIRPIRVAKNPDADYDYIDFHDKNRKHQKNRKFDSYEDSVTVKDSYKISKVISRPKLPMQVENSLRMNPIGKMNLDSRSQDRNRFQKNQKQLLSNYYMQSAESGEYVKKETDDIFGGGKDSLKPDLGNRKYSPHRSEEDDYFFDSSQDKPYIKPNRGGSSSRYKFRLKRDINEFIQNDINSSVNNESDTAKDEDNQNAAAGRLVSWTVDNDRTNYISRELDDINYDRIVPFIIIQNDNRPFEELQDFQQSEVMSATTNSIITSTENSIVLIDNDDYSQVTAAAPQFVDKPPKFLQFVTEKVGVFMDMINHHVGGWWNSWS